MPAATPYGIDLGNILSQASAIKTARLNLEAGEMGMEEKKAGIKLRENELSKEANVLAGDQDTMGILTPEEEIKLRARAPEVAKDIQATQQTQALARYFENRGATKEEATFRAGGFAKDLDDFSKEYRTKTEAEQQQIRNNIAQMGNQVQTVLETSAQNPQLANKMFTDYRSASDEQVKTLLRQGKIAEADRLQADLDKMPKSLIKADGSFDTEFLMLSLAKFNRMLTTEETYQTEQAEARKQADALALAKAKEKAPKGVKREFQQLMDQLNDPATSPSDKKLIQARLTKLSQPELSSLKINVDTVQKIQEAFAGELGLESPYQLSTVDTRTLTPEQQAQASQTASVIVKGLGANAKQVEKKMGEYGAASEQMQNALNAYEQVGDFRAADEFTKKYFSNYFGLSEDELKSTEAAQAFQSMLNIKIKADSGSAVSGQEMVRNVLETATPYMTKDKIKSGIKNVARRYIGELKSLKRVMGPIAFNLKYGAILSNYEDIAAAVDEVKEDTEADDLARLRKSKQPDQRQTLFNQIRAQRPNATDKQIDDYLTSKGY